MGYAPAGEEQRSPRLSYPDGTRESSHRDFYERTEARRLDRPPPCAQSAPKHTQAHSTALNRTQPHSSALKRSQTQSSALYPWGNLDDLNGELARYRSAGWCLSSKA